MTTIVYDHKSQEIAFDSRLTNGTDIATDKEIKYRYTGGGEHWFISGRTSDYKSFINNFSNNEDSSGNLDCIAIVLSDGNVYMRTIDNGVYCETPLDFNESVGSGYKWALSALDFGSTAFEAIAYASTKDTSTGGDIGIFDIKEESVTYKKLKVSYK